jgi:hypothetical protein
LRCTRMLSSTTSPRWIADAEFDGSLGRQAGFAHDHAVLDLDCAPHLVDHTAKFDEEPVAGALDHAPMMRGGRTLGSINPWKRRGRQRAQMPVPPRSEVRIPSAPPSSPNKQRWFPDLRKSSQFHSSRPAGRNQPLRRVGQRLRADELISVSTTAVIAKPNAQRGRLWRLPQHSTGGPGAVEIKRPPMIFRGCAS